MGEAPCATPTNAAPSGGGLRCLRERFSSLIGCSFILEEAINPETAKNSVERNKTTSPCALTEATNSIGRISQPWKFAGFCNRIRHERFGAGVCVYNLKKSPVSKRG